MAEIRAVVPEEIMLKWVELKDLLGTTKNSDALVNAINILHLQFCSSRYSDMAAKAARLISASKNFLVPLHITEIKRISLDANGVNVFTRHQGEPYVISMELWDRGC